MSSVFKYLVYLLTGVAIGAAILSASTPKAQSNSYKIVDIPKIQRAKPIIQRSQFTKRSARPKLRKGQLLKVGIIDTGYDKTYDDTGLPVCDKGHFDFATGQAKLAMGSFPHGVAVAQSVYEVAGDANICFVFYQVEGMFGITSANVDAALTMAKSEGLVAVNMSLTGPGYSFSEKKLIEDLAKAGISVFIAAGNDHKNLDTACSTYPGCYKTPNVYMVGALDGESDLIASYSNYGSKVDVWKSGEVQFRGARWRGTSFASPHALGDYVSSLASVLAGR